MNYEASYCRPKLLQAAGLDLPKPIAGGGATPSGRCVMLGVAAATAAPERPPQQHDVQAWRPLGCPRPA